MTTLDNGACSIHGSETGLAVIMPVFNESPTLDLLLPRVLAQQGVLEVLAVDDGSTDGSAEKVTRWAQRDSRVRLLRHEWNQGKGAAIRTAIPHVSAPVVIIQDADLEYYPEDYPRMLRLIESGRADVVYGSRFLTGARQVNSFWHTFGNRILTLAFNLASNLNLTDEATCYKMFRSEILARITLEEDGFGFCPELTAKIRKLGVKIYETPIQYSGRTRAEGKKIRLRDGLGALRCLIKYNWLDRFQKPRDGLNQSEGSLKRLKPESRPKTTI